VIKLACLFQNACLLNMPVRSICLFAQYACSPNIPVFHGQTGPLDTLLSATVSTSFPPIPSMTSPAELVKKVLVALDSTDVDGVIAPNLHEDFEYNMLPESLGMQTKSKAELVAWLKTFKTTVLYFKVIARSFKYTCSAHSLSSSLRFLI
jgi:hypothetical protein